MSKAHGNRERLRFTPCDFEIFQISETRIKQTLFICFSLKIREL
jgi:hypothetical protein